MLLLERSECMKVLSFKLSMWKYWLAISTKTFPTSKLAYSEPIFDDPGKWPEVEATILENDLFGVIEIPN